ncbi:MAG: hypothetical protein QNJ85_10520 [Gammaproteobacteria bacterium]|nr:hypothetical protein [Gammaproteobacteria bacterium]
MLTWVAAFHCEAKPVIDHYRLKKSHADHPFDLYEGDDCACIVTGQGKLAAAAACAWQGARMAGDGAMAWLNLGIAGAAEAEIGAAFQLDQIIDGDSGQRHYPVVPARGQLPAAACISLARVDDGYHPRHLYDMEASGYFYAATRFSGAELVQSIKVVSDNSAHNVARDRARVSELIAARLPALATEAARLETLVAEVERIQSEPATLPTLCARHRFSRTQQLRLRRLLRYLDLRGVDAAVVERATSSCRDGREALGELEKLCQRDSAAL